DEIAKRKGVSRDTVDRYFKILEKNGYLRIVKKGMGRGKGVRVFRFFSDVKISDFQFEIMKQRLNESISKLSTG
ncbi:helix-turn-helix domain-containing protein, partial [Streptococcus pneumoniae]